MAEDTTQTTDDLAGSGDALAARPTAARIRLLAAALALGAAAWIAVGVWTPVDELRTGDDLPFEGVRSHRGGWLTWHLLDGLGTALLMVGLAFAVCLLVQARGARWATVGAALAVLGGLVFSAGSVSFGLLGAYATESDALPLAAGKGLIEYVNEEGGPALGVVVPGFLVMTLAQLLLAVALWRARAVPVWLPPAVIVVNVVLFVAEGLVSGLALAALGVLYGLVAWQVWRASSAAVVHP
ncbi:hypothetical protein ACFQ6S_05960 [Streptomyces sp. NPDC056479]|uniref:hypothetical protein n=1 Tax=Streptomyces sp. NPDC056479 TaxID=3345832 RepID=UPI0036A6F130